MSDASQKAADKMHADLARMAADADRHGDHEPDMGAENEWRALAITLRRASAQVLKRMSERDRRIAAQG